MGGRESPIGGGPVETFTPLLFDRCGEIRDKMPPPIPLEGGIEPCNPGGKELKWPLDSTESGGG